MAVHLFPSEHYSFWSTRFGHTMYGWGHFGENLTTKGILENDLCLGDRLRVGQALLQITMPRTPCYKVEAVMSIRGFASLMAASGRVGCYLRVLEEGLAEAGQPLVFESRDPERVTIHEAFNIIIGRSITRELLERAAAVHSLTPKLKHKIDELFAKTDETR